MKMPLTTSEIGISSYVLRQTCLRAKFLLAKLYISDKFKLNKSTLSLQILIELKLENLALFQSHSKISCSFTQKNAKIICKLGIEVFMPTIGKLPSDNTEQYLRKIRKQLLKEKTQRVFCKKSNI